jgi:predicted RNase H-like nuclease
MRRRAASIRLAGIDLAWGERKPDGVCLIEANRRGARALTIGLTRGDAELHAWIDRHVGDGPALLAIDGPLVCPNQSGARPVDRLTHVHFGRYKCGCHPANARKNPRPPRVAAALATRGYAIDWRLECARVATEVYPHPAMVRLFDLPERVRYKKGPVADRRREFRRLQGLIRRCLARHFPALELAPAIVSLLRQPWTKDVEDQTDGFFCALIALWHWRHGGRRSEVLGDRETGFVLVPRP